MMDLKEKYGDWALITGASSGIGEEFAKQLAALKFNLVLVARRKHRLDELSEELIARHGIRTIVIDLDLTRTDALAEIGKRIDPIEVCLLVNNAGFALTGSFFDGQAEDQVQLLDLNCKVPLILSHYFGNKMIRKGEGAIINIASSAAFLPMPYWSNYAASKAYLLHFSEGLWYELKDKGIDVLAVCPGGTKTEFAERANVNLHGMEAKDVVSEALNSLGKKASVVSGFKNKFLTSLLRLCTRKARILIGAIFVRRMRG